MLTKNAVRHKGDGTSEIFLTHGKIALINTDDYPLLSAYRWFADQDKYTWYARAWNPSGSPKLVRMHRIILPGIPLLDHINHDGLDNRRSNLRAATNSINTLNQRKLKRDGVSFRKDRPKCWIASVKVDGKSIKQYFYTQREAILASREMRVILESVLDT